MEAEEKEKTLKDILHSTILKDILHSKIPCVFSETNQMHKNSKRIV